MQIAKKKNIQDVFKSIKNSEKDMSKFTVIDHGKCKKSK